MHISENELVVKRVKDLKSIVCNLRVRSYSNMKKEELILVITNFNAACVIQRWFRKIVGINDICPFTLEKVVYPCYGKKVKGGFVYCSLSELANFLVTSGDFREPNTRMEYNTKELDYIQSLVKYYKVKVPKSLNTARVDLDYYRKKKVLSEQIDILAERVRFTSWIIRETIDEIILGEENIEDTIINMDNVYLPELSECIAIINDKAPQYVNISIDSAKKIIDDVSIDCSFVDKIKNHFYAWWIIEISKYNE
jgi:hypothetical protein